MQNDSFRLRHHLPSLIVYPKKMKCKQAETVFKTILLFQRLSI